MKRLLLVLAVLWLASSASGQHWSAVLPPTYHADFALADPYFLNPDTGFAFGSVGNDRGWDSVGYLFRTTDGGKNWTRLYGLESLKVKIWNMQFTTPTHGYAMVNGYSPPYFDDVDSLRNGIYVTDDLGMTWRRVTPLGRTFYSFYAAHGSLFAFPGSAGGGYDGMQPRLFLTRDDGTHWDSIVAFPTLMPATLSVFDSQAGVLRHFYPWFYRLRGNRDSLVAALFYQPKGLSAYIAGLEMGKEYLLYSTNLGASWTTVSLDTNCARAFGTLAIPAYSCQIVRTIGIPGSSHKIKFLEGGPPFNSWDTIASGGEHGGSVGGKQPWPVADGCLRYLMNESANDTCLYRSTDYGHTWSGILAKPGPKFFYDCCQNEAPAISVVGHGAVIYACDDGGQVWKTTDGGDGALTPATLAPRFALAHIPFSSGNDTLLLTCAQGRVVVTNQNVACSYAKFDSIVLAGLDPSEYSVVSTHHCGCTPMPDTSFITLQPKTAGTRDVTIHYHLTDDEFNQIDTSIAIVLVVKPGGTSVLLNMYMKQSTIIARGGDTIDIPLYLSGNVSLTGATSLLLPFTLDTNVLRVLSFNPAVAGITVGSLSYSKGTETVPLQASDLAVNGETLIGTLRCIVYLADTLQTSVSLAGATLSSEDSRCVSLSLQTNAVNIALTGCGDSTLLRFMKDGIFPSAIASIAPNPVVSFLLVRWNGSGITYDITDALGILREHSLATSGQSEIDVRSWPSGVYYIRARGNNGMISTRRFVVAK